MLGATGVVWQEPSAALVRGRGSLCCAFIHAPAAIGSAAGCRRRRDSQALQIKLGKGWELTRACGQRRVRLSLLFRRRTGDGTLHPKSAEVLVRDLIHSPFGKFTSLRVPGEFAKSNALSDSSCRKIVERRVHRVWQGTQPRPGASPTRSSPLLERCSQGSSRPVRPRSPPK